MPLGTEVGLGPDDIVLDRDPATPIKKGQSPLPNFQPMSIVAKRLDGSRWHLAWHGIGPRPRPHCARWGLSSLPKKGQSLQFSAHFYRGQTDGWIQMPLGMEVGLGPDGIVLDGDRGPKKGIAPSPIVGSCLLWLNGCMYQDTTWYEGRP